MSKNDEQKESPKHTQFYIKDIQFTELNNHVGWTTEWHMSFYSVYSHIICFIYIDDFSCPTNMIIQFSELNVLNIELCMFWTFTASFVSQPYLFLPSVFLCIRPLYNDPLSNATNDHVLWVKILRITTIRRLFNMKNLLLWTNNRYGLWEWDVVSRSCRYQQEGYWQQSLHQLGKTEIVPNGFLC
jgi:hypothetical protein